MPAVAEAQQGKTGSSVTSLVTGTFATPPSVGDLIVVFVSTQASASAHTAPTDSAGHTATQCGSQSTASGMQLSVWRFENLTAGTGLGSYVVTAHWASTSGTVIAVRVTGNAAAAYNGDIVPNSLTTLTTSTNPSVGPTTVAPASASIFFGVLAPINVSDTDADGTNIAWTHVANEVQTDNSSFDNLYVEHFVNTDATMQTAKWINATSRQWFAAVLSFAPLASGAVFRQVSRPFPFTPGGRS